MSAAVARNLKLKAFAKRWLSDPSTYPIIGVMGAAVGLYTTMATHELKHPAAKFGANARHVDRAPDAPATEQWNDHMAKRHAQSRLQNGAKRDEQQTRVNVEILPGMNTILRKVTGH